MKLLDICKIGGKSVNKFDGEKKYIATGDVINNEIVSYKLVSYIGKPSRANITISNNDVLFAKMQNTIKVINASDSNIENIYSTGFYVLTPNNNITQMYLYHYLKSNVFNSQKDKNCSGATQKAINNEGLSKIMIGEIPNIEKQNTIVEKLNKLESLINFKQREIDKLGELIKSQFVNHLTCGGVLC